MHFLNISSVNTHTKHYITLFIIPILGFSIIFISAFHIVSDTVHDPVSVYYSP